MNKIIRFFVGAMLSICIMACNTTHIHAHNVEVNSKEVYELRNDEGKLIAIYVPNENISYQKTISPRYTASINWSITSKQSKYGENRYSLSNGATIATDISISPSGNSSTIGLYDVNNNKYVFSSTGTQTNKFAGTITILETGVYSIAIRNNTNNTITYSGAYTL